MNIELIDLRLFERVATCKNLTHGAREAFLSPPAASARIKALEEEVGRKLLARGNKGVSLTGAGEVFLRQARLVLRQVDFLKDEMINPDTGHIRISANTTALTEFLPEILANFLAERPGVTVDLQERLTHQIVQSVRDGTSDLGIVSGEPEVGDLDLIHFSTDLLKIAVPAGHTLASKRSVSLEQTLSFEHIGLHEGSTLLDFLRRQLRRSGFDQSLRLQVRSFEAMCRLVEAGVGIAIVPESAALRHAKTMKLTLLDLDEDWAIRSRSVLVRDRNALPVSTGSLIENLVALGAGGKPLSAHTKPPEEE